MTHTEDPSAASGSVWLRRDRLGFEGEPVTGVDLAGVDAIALRYVVEAEPIVDAPHGVARFDDVHDGDTALVGLDRAASRIVGPVVAGHLRFGIGCRGGAWGRRFLPGPAVLDQRPMSVCSRTVEGCLSNVPT